MLIDKVCSPNLCLATTNSANAEGSVTIQRGNEDVVFSSLITDKRDKTSVRKISFPASRCPYFTALR